MKEIYRVKKRNMMINSYAVGLKSLNDIGDDRIDGWRIGSQVQIV